MAGRALCGTGSDLLSRSYLRFQMATSQLDNTARVKQVKKDIARIMTEMRARELSA